MGWPVGSSMVQTQSIIVKISRFSKNTAFTVNFGQMPAPLSGLTPGYPPLGQLNVSDGLIRGPAAPKSRQECQVLLMVGLPGAGKTYWAEKHRKEYPEKYFNILGK